MLKTKDGKLNGLTVADPSRKLSRMVLSVSGIYKTESESCKTLVDEKQNSTMFIVDLPLGVYLGKSVDMKIEKR